MPENVEKHVFVCANCKQKLRIPIFPHKTLKVTCPQCRTEVEFNCGTYLRNKNFTKTFHTILVIIFVITYLALPIFFKLKAGSVETILTEKFEREKQKIKNADEINALKEKYQKEIEKIDPAKLMLLSKQHYENELQKRKEYDARYAITPREKVQLEFLALASDKTKSIEEMLVKVAKKAAPENSEVNVSSTASGIVIDINFDMSELTSGEEGTRTKHLTTESLKKEVIRLISQVTNDVYEFCRDIDIESMLVGCKHYVGQEDMFGRSTRSEDMVLYKIRLDKNDIKSLEHNPFLDTYTTTKYFKVEIDEFSNLTIVQEPI